MRVKLDARTENLPLSDSEAVMPTAVIKSSSSHRSLAPARGKSFKIWDDLGKENKYSF